MRPVLSALDLANECLADAVPFRNGALLSRISADFQNLFFCQFRASVLHATSFVQTALAYLVIRVVLVSSYKQMRWLNATRCVAFVQNAKPVRYWSNKDVPRESMRHPSDFIDGDPRVAPLVLFSDRAYAATRRRFKVACAKKKISERFARMTTFVKQRLLHATPPIKAKEPVSRIGRAGPLSLFPAY